MGLAHFWRKSLQFVIPAKAEALFNSAKRWSIKGRCLCVMQRRWVPAFAGMTGVNV
jgi:hypothetical protein